LELWKASKQTCKEMQGGIKGHKKKGQRKNKKPWHASLSGKQRKAEGGQKAQSSKEPQCPPEGKTKQIRKKERTASEVRKEAKKPKNPFLELGQRGKRGVLTRSPQKRGAGKIFLSHLVAYQHAGRKVQ